MSVPILPLAVWQSGTNENSLPANDNALRVEAMSRPCLGVSNNPAGSDGDVYLVGSAPTGAFAAFDQHDIAIFREPEGGGSGAWYAWAPVDGIRLVVADVRKVYVGDSTDAWEDDPSVSGGGGGAVDSVNDATGDVIVEDAIIAACSDETTALVAGTAKITFRMPYKCILTRLPRASLSTEQTGNGAGGIITVDINKNGVSIFNTRITIDNGEKTSTTAAAMAILTTVPNFTQFADDDEITIDLDQVGDGTAKGLKVMLPIRRVP